MVHGLDGLEGMNEANMWILLQLKEIKDKKIRRFYEDQNERLNDWLEVDTLVRHVAVRKQ